MEFNYRSGEDRVFPIFSSSSSSDGYFTEQALRAGFLGRGMGSGSSIVPPMSAREALMRELQKERIREELLVREIAQKRILEEEVRREMELERAMAMKRLHLEPFHSEPVLDRVMPFVAEARGGERVGPDLLPRSPEVRSLKRSLLPIHPKSTAGKKLSSLTESEPSNTKLSGMKRKASSEIPLPAHKEWSCALCQVSTTSQVDFNKHLQGKRHKSNESLLGGANKETPKTTTASTSKAKGRMIISGLVKKNVKKNATEGKKEKQQKIWCKLCRVKCNSPAMLTSHLQGKKHKMQMEESTKRKDENPKGASMATAEVVKEVTDQKAKPEENVKEAKGATGEVDGSEAAT